MKKSRLVITGIVLALILLISASFISAGWISDLWGKITGDAIKTGDFNCNKVWSSTTWTGTHDKIGMLKVVKVGSYTDSRFMCYFGTFYECGWNLNDASLAIEAKDGQIVGSWKCDLKNKKWVSKNTVLASDKKSTPINISPETSASDKKSTPIPITTVLAASRFSCRTLGFLKGYFPSKLNCSSEDSCPAGYISLGKTKDCISCCALGKNILGRMPALPASPSSTPASSEPSSTPASDNYPAACSSNDYCKDSDNGIDLNTKGIVTYSRLSCVQEEIGGPFVCEQRNNEVAEDSCKNYEALTEYYCLCNPRGVMTPSVQTPSMGHIETSCNYGCVDNEGRCRKEGELESYCESNEAVLDCRRAATQITIAENNERRVLFTTSSGEFCRWGLIDNHCRTYEERSGDYYDADYLAEQTAREQRDVSECIASCSRP